MNSIPYSKLAHIYDKVMSHVNYKMWAEYVANLLQFSEIKITNILDISCGTARHIQFLNGKRYNIIGADISFAMLQAAKKNNQNHLNLVTSDARKTAFKNNAFDVVLMLYDSINYLLHDSEVDAVLDEACRLLRPGGHFVFDFVTERGLKDCYDNYFESDSWNGLAYERYSWFSRKDKVQHNEFLFLFNGQSYKEVHVQKIHGIRKWRAFVKKSKMQLSHEFSNFSFLAPDKQSERIHFVCRKEME